ncbi:MAG: glycosyltransferase family 4 protein [Chloroflexi bacterium]|nr:glycosyltransferase family 4 protein [Chloroflexota bacterium]
MRIGLDARILGYHLGGISSYVRNLAAHLPEQLQEGDQLVLLSSRSGRSLLSPLGNDSKTSQRTLYTPPHHRWEQVLLPIEIALASVDLLHSPDFIPPFRRHWRSVITVHDLAFLRFPELLTPESTLYYSQVERAVREADLVIAVSQTTKQDLIHLLGVTEDRIRVIYEAPDSIFRPISRAEAAAHVAQRFDLHEPFVLFVGTIEPRKNLPLLLDALAYLNQQAVKLAVAGSKGWLYDEVFQRVEELKLSHGVAFLGPVEPKELLHLYNSALALVHPARYEGFGLTIVEALACGVPVIATAAGSVPEITGGAAFLVPPDNPAELAAALVRVLGDSALQMELRQRGMARAAWFSWHEAARKTWVAYREAMV